MILSTLFRASRYKRLLQDPPSRWPSPDPVTKCNDCGKFVKQSVLKEHKMEHLKGESNEQEQEIGLVTPSRPKPFIRMQLFKKSKGALDDENNDAINPSDTSDEPVTPVPKRRKVARSQTTSDRSETSQKANEAPCPSGRNVDASRLRTVRTVSSKFGDVGEEKKVRNPRYDKTR